MSAVAEFPGPGAEYLWEVLVITLVGWVWGSYLNQVVDRTPPKGREAETFSSATGRSAPVTLLYPSLSICLNCKHQIAWYDNIPVLSYLWLRGRCRHCGHAFGIRTLVLEILTPLVFLALSLLAVRGDFHLLSWCGLAFSWGLVATVLILEQRGFKQWFLMIGGGLWIWLILAFIIL